MMPQPAGSLQKRLRVTVDVPPGVRRRLRLAAAKHDVAVGRYVLDAIEERLRQDLGSDDEAILGLTARADPVLAELWNNAKDSAYDRL
jgi:hypothetical protein